MDAPSKKRVLILGGYGFFGGRIAERLARDATFQVVVGGRSLSKAEAFCEARPALRLLPAAVDRDGDLVARLRQIEPWLVIDAAGPFQAAAYAAAEACIETGVHYIDIADAREFVARFSSLDARARVAGVTLISGASSVPALSSAVVGRLSEGFDEVRLIETAITAGARAAVGRSVVRGILFYVGRPVVLRQRGRSIEARGWRSLRRLTLEAGDAAPLRRRWVALCDVPDLTLLSDGREDRPLVLFRAGVELAAQTWALWLVSWPVQWGWARSLAGLAPLLEAGRRWMGGLGDDRSGMQVEVAGVSGGRPASRRWTLIAPPGRGAQTPCLAAPLLARRLADGDLPAGARPAVGLLALEDFQADFDALEFAVATTQAPPLDDLYRRVMGEAFDRLPPAVREIHEVAGARLTEGRAKVTRGRNPIARLVADLIGFPQASDDVAVTVRFFEQDGVEVWERRFGEARFCSRLRQQGELLIESFGPLHFGFTLDSDEKGLSMRLVRWWAGPVPMPLWLAPQGPANETAPDGRFRFEVGIKAPLIGELVSYDGWLEPR